LQYWPRGLTPAPTRSYERATRGQGIAQKESKAQQQRLVAPLTDSNTHETRTMASHRTVRRHAHRLLGQKIDLRSGGASKVGRWHLWNHMATAHRALPEA